LDHVLILEEDFTFSPAALERLNGQGWLGSQVPRAIGCNRMVFDRVLADLPDTPSGIALWLRKQGSLDAYYTTVFADASAAAGER
jgi:hypothetical protein